MTVDELKATIRELPWSDLSELTTWLQAYVADEWDKQIEIDASAGKLDPIVAEALREFTEGRCEPIGDCVPQNGATKSDAALAPERS